MEEVKPMLETTRPKTSDDRAECRAKRRFCRSSEVEGCIALVVEVSDEYAKSCEGISQTMIMGRLKDFFVTKGCNQEMID